MFGGKTFEVYNCRGYDIWGIRFLGNLTFGGYGFG